MSEAVAAIGVPLYERAEYLPAALDSLLGQTFQDLRVLLLDDCSGDETAAVAQAYADADARVAFHRNPRRLGLVESWRTAFTLARERWPEARYFAWGSDHDLWHEEWLESLAAELDDHPEAVLVYPQSIRVSAAGELVRGPWTFDTAGERSPLARFRRTSAGLSAGNMVYGLFRADALAQVSPFPLLVGPDRLLLVRLSLLGEFRQVPRVLWQRRFDVRSNPRRQRAAFFPNERTPLHAYVPWWLAHASVLGWRLAVRGEARPGLDRVEGAAAALWYAWRAGAHVAAAGARRNAGRVRRVLSRVSMGTVRGG